MKGAELFTPSCGHFTEYTTGSFDLYSVTAICFACGRFIFLIAKPFLEM